MARRHSPGRQIAARVAHEALEQRGVTAATRIRRVVHLGEGLTYRTWGVEVTWPAGDGEQYAAMVVRLPHRQAAADQPDGARCQAALLRHLATLALPFEVPEAMELIETRVAGRPMLAVVQEWIEGIALDFKLEGRPGQRPWELVARVAAACHTIDPEPLRPLLPGHPTRRDHALAELHDAAPEAVAELAPLRRWGEAHLPPATPARLLHGDLLGQNLLLRLDPDLLADPTALPLTVIDWDLSKIGDPAADLAIATRGQRRPFGHAGLRELIEAYNGLAPEPVAEHEVRLHELCILARGYRQARDHGSVPQAENELRRVRNLIPAG